MHDKPRSVDGYDRRQTSLVRATCLSVAVDLGDHMDDIVVVGGLVPALLIDQKELPPGTIAHPGTMDLDIGFSLAAFDAKRYAEMSKRLRGVGFVPDKNENGNVTVQRWVREDPGRVTVDFLMPRTTPSDAWGSIKHLEPGFGALVTRGLELAFRDAVTVTLRGQTLIGEDAARTVRVAGPGAFVVLKALAFGNRAEPKDAYDLFYVLRNFGSGLEQVVGHMEPLLEHDAAQAALDILQRDFAGHDSPGPVRTGRFLYRERHAETEADVVGFVSEFLRLCGR